MGLCNIRNGLALRNANILRIYAFFNNIKSQFFTFSEVLVMNSNLQKRHKFLIHAVQSNTKITIIQWKRFSSGKKRRNRFPGSFSLTSSSFL